MDSYQRILSETAYSDEYLDDLKVSLWMRKHLPWMLHVHSVWRLSGIRVTSFSLISRFKTQRSLFFLEHLTIIVYHFPPRRSIFSQYFSNMKNQRMWNISIFYHWWTTMLVEKLGVQDSLKTLLMEPLQRFIVRALCGQSLWEIQKGE